MLPQYYKFSHGLCLNNFIQILLIINQGYQVPIFRYIHWAYEESHLIRVNTVIGHMKYLMRSSKKSAEVV